VRVIRKVDPDAPHSCLLVLDATTGQNAHAQVETFKTSRRSTPCGDQARRSAKARLVALAEKFRLPVVAVGVGEGIDDLVRSRPAFRTRIDGVAGMTGETQAKTAACGDSCDGARLGRWCCFGPNSKWASSPGTAVFHRPTAVALPPTAG